MRLDSSGGLKISVQDTGSGFTGHGVGGVGLENVTRRLELCYGPGARVEIDSANGRTTVSFAVPASAAEAALEAVR